MGLTGVVDFEFVEKQVPVGTKMRPSDFFFGDGKDDFGDGNDE